MRLDTHRCSGMALANYFRDDLTVEVIFFGEGDRSGNVVQNTEASASNADAKAKL